MASVQSWGTGGYRSGTFFIGEGGGRKRGRGDLVTSMDHDGTHQGFACEATGRVADLVNIPVIASGGAGCPDDFYEALTRGKADAVLAAGVFHFGQIRIPELKCFLKGKGIVVR